jgi:ureidoglycolate lyase
MNVRAAMKTILSAQPITAQAFAPFGELLSLETAQKFPCNQGRAVRFHDLATQIDCDDQLGRMGMSVYQCEASHLPFHASVMECHPLGSQTFYPLTMDPGQRYLVAVAPAGEWRRDAVSAFVVQGHQGIHYRKGVWHLPIVALDLPLNFVSLDRIGPGTNLQEVTVDFWIQPHADQTSPSSPC